MLGLIQSTSEASRTHSRIHDQTLEGMIQIPMIDQMLVVPLDLTRVGIQCEGRVVIQVVEFVSTKRELRCGRCDRRADIDEAEFGIIAGHHPGANVPTVFKCDVAPGFVSRFSRGGNRTRTPELFSRCRVVGGDDAGVRAAFGLTTPAGDDLAIRNDRTRCLLSGIYLVIKNQGFPTPVLR